MRLHYIIKVRISHPLFSDFYIFLTFIYKKAILFSVKTWYYRKRGENNMKQKLQQFMIGRYGFDSFSKFTLGVALALCVLDIFINSRFLTSWFYVLIIYSYYRAFSKNHQKRYQENMKFLQIKNKITAKFNSEKNLMKQRKTHHIYKCPTCNQKIRIPKGKGRICITCPKCKTEFTKTS